MNELTEEQIIAFMSILIKLDLNQTQVLGISAMLKNEEMLFEMLEKMVEKDFKLTPQETVNICGGVIEAHLSDKNTFREEI